ncbi:tetratricopeptide repeat protein [Pseudocnuella soli]|uniref:tetratricopeptide repeat protein n=1 Tax=Pseudocnuella soli TaxID=2502779 RepID=UPI00104E699F|nr:tetratricopeptide repeat protein [Pseudocnuella soli]
MNKLTTTLGALLLITGPVLAQNIEDANKSLYYERYQSARDAFSQITAQQPENGEAWLGLTQALLAQDSTAAANGALAAAPQSVAGQPMFQVAKGAALLDAAKKDSATYYFEQALNKTKQKDAAVLKAVAAAHLQAEGGDAAVAADLLQKAIKRDKRDAALYTLLGDAYRKLGKSGEAFQMYQEAIAKDAKHARAHYQLGDIFLSQKNAEMYVQHFENALAADPNYGPALEKLYAYEFARNPAKAKEYYNRFLSNTDTSVANQYDLADLLYLNKEYNEAIAKAKGLIGQEGDAVQPRIFKLIGYSYAGLKDTAQALTYFNQYFEKAPDSMVIAQDYMAMGDFVMAGNSADKDSLASVYLTRAVALEPDSAARYQHYRKLADMAGARKAYAEQGKWLQQYYTGNNAATNLDLFNTGLAYFRAEDYAMADSIYGMYTQKYPEQSFGYYWLAKSKALLDPEMKEGLAVPVYQQLIEVLQKDTSDANYQKWMVEAYGYLAAYEANSQKDYTEAIGYFEKLLEVDPGNADAKKYIEILEKDTSSK